MTGHTRDGAEQELSDSLADCRDRMTTLVFYMGLQTLPELRSRLMAAGVDPELPAVAVERGTTPEQREAWAPLSRFVEAVQEHGLQSPTLIIMGQVVALAKGWQQHSSVPIDIPSPAQDAQTYGSTSVIARNLSRL
jgi:siroheme synthase